MPSNKIPNSLSKGFYSTSYLNKIGENAKNINKDPVLKNVKHLKEEIIKLKQNHREFLFQSLQQQFGAAANSLMQSDIIKEKINNFEDLDSRDIKNLSKEVGSQPSVDINAILRGGGVFSKPTNPETVKEEFINKSGQNVPNLLKGNSDS